MVVKEEYRISSQDGKSSLHCIMWKPESEPVAVLQIAHGMVEYLERYAPFAEFLTKKGFVVAGHDHIGHEGSVSNTADWGVMDCENPNDVMVDDMYTHFRMLNRRFSDKPYFILGHSMGSYLLRQMLSQKSELLFGLDGAIIMGTGSEKDSTIDMGLAIVKFLAAFRGWRYKSPFVAKLMFTRPYRDYDITGTYTENSWLTRDKEIVHKYYKDPKCTFMFSLGAFKGLFQACKYDNNPDNIAKIPKKLPMLFVSGEKDPVGCMGKAVKKVYNDFRKAGIENVSLKLFKDDRHEILNELDRDDVYDYLYGWMKDIIESGHYTKIDH